MDEMKEIAVGSVIFEDNSRTRTDESDVSSLMQDIKEHGLNHPIGVYPKDGEYVLVYGSRRLKAFKKLGFQKIPAKIFDEELSKTTHLLINTNENLQREDLKPHEIGRVCSLLQEQGLNKKEIATRLNMTLGMVEKVLKIFKEVPIELHKDIENVKNTRNIEGKLSVQVVSNILGLRTERKNKIKLLNYAKRNGLTVSDITSIDLLLRQGNSFEQAIDKLKDVKNLHTYIIVKRKLTSQFLKENNIGFNEYVRKVLKGEMKPNPNLLA